MRRREFISLLGGAAVAYPLAVRAQPSDQLRRIAVLGTSPSDWGDRGSAFVERLRELGWKEGRTGVQCRLRVCAVIRRRFPVGASPTRRTLQPEATGAAMEVTK